MSEEAQAPKWMYSEIKRKGIRYGAHDIDRESARKKALAASKPPKWGRFAEEPGSARLKLMNRLKKMAVRTAEAAVPGVNAADYFGAAELTSKALGAKPNDVETVDAAAEFLHFFFNVCGIGYEMERRIALEHLRELMEGHRARTGEP